MSACAPWSVYQPLIVGFGAVVLAAVGQTVVEWYRQHSTHARRARTVRLAFLEELKAHRSIVAGSISADQKEDPGSQLLIPIDRFYPVYDHMVQDIGLLKPAEVAALFKAYSNLILVPKNFAVFGQIKKDDFASFAVVDSKYLNVLIDMNDGLVEILDDAIACLTGPPRPN